MSRTPSLRFTSLNAMTPLNATAMSSQYEDVSNRIALLKKIYIQQSKVCKKKNLSWVWGVDRKIRPLRLVWHHEPSFVMPDSNAWDGFFSLPLKTMIDSYNPHDLLFHRLEVYTTKLSVKGTVPGEIKQKKKNKTKNKKKNNNFSLWVTTVKTEANISMS